MESAVAERTHTVAQGGKAFLARYDAIDRCGSTNHENGNGRNNGPFLSCLVLVPWYTLYLQHALCSQYLTYVYDSYSIQSIQYTKRLPRSPLLIKAIFATVSTMVSVANLSGRFCKGGNEPSSPHVHTYRIRYELAHTTRGDDDDVQYRYSTVHRVQK